MGLRKAYHNLRKLYKLLIEVNWTKTIYFNFKKLPYSVAKKLPVFFYGKVKFSDLTGRIEIKSTIRTGMIGFGQKFEITTLSKGTANFFLKGHLVFKGDCHIGNDFLIYIEKDAYCEFGNMSLLGSDVKLVCKEKIVLGAWTAVAYESQIIDTNSHRSMHSETRKLYKMTRPILLGSHNSISTRVTVLPGTITPNYVITASNSLLNKDYTSLGEQILIGGLPAKLLKTHYVREWGVEKDKAIKHRVKYNYK